MDRSLNGKMKSRIYVRRVLNLCRFKLNSDNLTIPGINSWTDVFLKYSRGSVEWSKEELKILERKSR